MNQISISLSNVKHAAFASHETDCFSAKVYIDGKLAGSVSNDGQGGANLYQPHALGEQLAAYAATLPTYESCGMTIQPDADYVIGRLFDDHQARTQLVKVMKTCVAFEDEGKLWTLRVNKGIPVADAAARYAAKNPTHKVLNLMPEPEAIELFKRLSVA